MKARPKNIQKVTLYSETFKQLVTKEYEQGLLSIEGLRNKYGIDTCHEILSWIGHYTNKSSVSNRKQYLNKLETQIALNKHKLQYS
ncbi:hypothetical protein [Spongiivirga citrea]|uniref:Transposase n=1 Tax=Spongiivirga citrea TaxID=1481457 RepID=A0A6M0CEA0_9FLAO|nr:hypothetical protein [Spongiivirga citrea]NER16156.1 hypothetical protein [Spongiivirga citrea]